MDDGHSAQNPTLLDQRAADALRLTLAPWSFAGAVGQGLVQAGRTAKGLAAFGLIILGVVVTKFGMAREVTGPAIRRELARTGVRALPLFLFISLAFGLVVVGGTISLFSKAGFITSLLGRTMVVVVVRELGPLFTAMLVLARSGTRNVIELGTTRALGELEALEALRIDPIHYLVMPRVIGMALAVFALTIYFILGALVSGYLFAFVNNVPLQPDEYYHQLTGALTGLDFVVLALKSTLFGTVIAVVTCYHGLAQPLRLEEISRATIQAVVQSVIACVLLDVAFSVIYLVT
jgi:phospholipid/cholesterol/gamma-HCH transport system permease protein